MPRPAVANLQQATELCPRVMRSSATVAAESAYPGPRAWGPGGWTMKRIALLGVVALGVGCAHNALAADYPMVAPPVYQAPVAFAPTWTGLYIGFNAGWGWAGTDEGKFLFKGTGFASFEAKPFTETISSP